MINLETSIGGYVSTADHAGHLSAIPNRSHFLSSRMGAINPLPPFEDKFDFQLTIFGPAVFCTAVAKAVSRDHNGRPKQADSTALSTAAWDAA